MALLRRRDDARWASIFAGDLRAGCAELFAVAGSPGSDSLTLPISIPIDEDGVVLLRPEGPLDAPRVPATMHLTRSAPDAYALRLARQDGGRLVIPGLASTGDVKALSFAIGRRGMAIHGWGAGGEAVQLRVDEETARALANALFITLRMKVIKAQREAG